MILDAFSLVTPSLPRADDENVGFHVSPRRHSHHSLPETLLLQECDEKQVHTPSLVPLCVARKYWLMRHARDPAALGGRRRKRKYAPAKTKRRQRRRCSDRPDLDGAVHAPDSGGAQAGGDGGGGGV